MAQIPRCSAAAQGLCDAVEQWSCTAENPLQRHCGPGPWTSDTCDYPALKLPWRTLLRTSLHSGCVDIVCRAVATSLARVDPIVENIARITQQISARSMLIKSIGTIRKYPWFRLHGDTASRRDAWGTGQRTRSWGQGHGSQVSSGFPAHGVKVTAVISAQAPWHAWVSLPCARVPALHTG